jgi:hypothetical protein
VDGEEVETEPLPLCSEDPPDVDGGGRGLDGGGRGLVILVPGDAGVGASIAHHAVGF